MSIRSLLLKTVLASVLVGAGTLGIPAQTKHLPGGLTADSSVEEILRWLDSTSLPLARIGLESTSTGPEPGEIPTNATTYHEWAIFGAGFRLKEIDRCKATFVVDDVRLVSFSTKYPDPKKGSLLKFRALGSGGGKSPGELSVGLNRLKSNKSPFRHTKKPEKEQTLGIWRTEFILKSDFFFLPTASKIKSLMENSPTMRVVGTGTDGSDEYMGGSELTFTFGDKDMSEQFFSAFSRAIELCKGK